MGTRLQIMRGLSALGSVLAVLALTGCPGSAQLQSATSNQSTTLPVPSPSASVAPAVISGGARAARIIFKQNYPGGSFDAPPVNGTPPVPGQGFAATRVFNADGSLLANGSAAPTWPAWLSRVEIGISGSNNTAASNADCARFSGASDPGGKCCVGVGAGPVCATQANCGATSGYFRVSELDCAQAAPNNGNGGPGDGVYIRANFDRTNLGTQENIMAVLEYAASSADPPPADPTKCFNNGVFDPSVGAAGCSDQVWSIYLKHSPSEIVQPYLLLIPPSLAHIDFTNGTAGAGITSKQFYIPFAADQGLTTIQITRVASGLTKTSAIVGAGGLTFTGVCNPASASAANSPLCAGLVLYSITFFRI